MLLLTVLLYYTGGPANPFTVFYLVNIPCWLRRSCRRSWAWVLDIAAFLCFAFLFFAHVSLGALEHGHDHEHAMHHGTRTAPGPMSLHLQGSLIAFGGAATFIVYFITRISTELTRRDAELYEARQRKSQSDKLAALATLAAGAAHELATPLSTIAILARDLELDLADSDLSEQTVHDVQLIRAEVDRCRRILDSMAAGAGESVGEELVELSPEELVESAFRELSTADRIEFEMPADGASRCCRVPKLALCQSLRALVQNGFDASPASGRVRITCVSQDSWLAISIADSGAGMADEVLHRAGEPFFTTKEPGSGMGLGLFLARRVVERIGGSLTLESTVGVGTKATIRLPLAPSTVLVS